MKPSDFTRLLLLSSLITFTALPSLTGSFVSDDFELINGVRLFGPFGIFSIHSGFVRPVISLSFFIDYSLWGLNPIGYKITNLLFHLANSILVFYIVREITKYNLTSTLLNPEQVGFLSSVIFALLPSHAEAVSWISGRTDVIAAFWALCAFWAYLRFSHHGGNWWNVASVIFFSISLFSKEAVVTLPVIMGAYSLYLFVTKKSTRQSVIGTITCACLLLAYGVFRFISVGGLGGYGASVHLSMELDRILASPFFFLGRTIWPCCWPAGFFAGTSSFPDLIRWMLLFYLFIGAAFIVVVLFFTFQSENHWEKRWLVLFLLAAAVIAQLPSMTLGFQAETRIGERLVYLPSIFLSAIIGATFATIISIKRSAGLFLYLLLVIVYGANLYDANTKWYQAGTIVRNILNSSRSLETMQVNYLILPDHLNGAFIFRNGFQQAADLFGINGEWENFALVTLNHPDDTFSIQKTGAGYTIFANDPKNRFILSLLESSEVSFPNGKDPSKITIRASVPFAYYSKSVLVPVP